MYPAEIVLPMKKDLVDSGYQDLTSVEDVDDAVNSEGGVLIIINSVCGCAAGNMRPGVKLSLNNEKTPSAMGTVFAGFDTEATAQARRYFLPFPPSSPSIGLFKGGKLVHFIERHHIEGASPQMIAENLASAFNEFC